MHLKPHAIPDVKLMTPVRHGDHRGFFSEVYNRRALLSEGVDIDFVQDNHSLSTERGTVRGLHFQVPPFAQAKLVRVLSGSAFDVAVDLRRGSPTFGRHVSVTLSAAEGNQILVPAGFAHGLMTLQPRTEVLYKVSDYYAPDHDRGILWNDPALEIDWPITGPEAVVSDKDLAQPTLADFATPFEYVTARRGNP